jgi:hypothetical protein
MLGASGMVRFVAMSASAVLQISSTLSLSDPFKVSDTVRTSNPIFKNQRQMTGHTVYEKCKK